MPAAPVAQLNSPSNGTFCTHPRNSSPSATPPPALSRKNSPSTPQTANFGLFFVRWANFFAHSPTIRPNRANFIPHAEPLPVQNSPSTHPRRAQPVQNSPRTPGSAAQPVQNSPGKRPWQAHPAQNSPSTPQNADFGPFSASRENFVPLPPPTRRAGRKKSRTNTPPHPNNASLPQFRMQFDCVNFQLSPETLQSQRSQFKSQNTPRGIACEIDEAGFEGAGGSGGHGRAPEGPAAVPVGGGGAWPDFETTRRATHQRPGPTGVEGAGGTCRGAGGRWRGLAGQHTDNKPRPIGGRRGACRAWPGFEARRRTK